MTRLIPALMIAAFPALSAGQAQQPKEILLRGIKDLAISVDKMDQADAACGLTEETVRAAAAKALADNSVEVSPARRDFVPFLYIRTTSLHTREGECITHVMTSLRAFVTPPHLVWTPEQPAVSLEAVLQEQGGLIYSPDAAGHAQSVAGAAGRYAARIATAIRAVNK